MLVGLVASVNWAASNDTGAHPTLHGRADHHHRYRRPPPPRSPTRGTTTSASRRGSARVPPVRAAWKTYPLTVWVIGDSTAQALGQLLENHADRPPGDRGHPHRATADYAAALTRRDFYDWPAALPAHPRRAAPPRYAVVVSMGDNDRPGPPRPQAPRTYVDVGDPGLARRVHRAASPPSSASSPPRAAASTSSASPSSATPTFDSPHQPWSTARVPRPSPPPTPTSPTSTPGPSSSGDAGAYTDRLPGAGGARSVPVRNSDGIHLSLEGARWMATVVGRLDGRRLRRPGRPRGHRRLISVEPAGPRGSAGQVPANLGETLQRPVDTALQ